jgi:serine/threonine protein kinase
MINENSGLTPVGDNELFMAATVRGFEPGLVVFGRFVLRRILGRGGMGVVWLAYDNQLEQEVAIKVLPDVVMHDREAVSDMKRETRRSLQLNHHNIVRIYDFNQDEKGAGISMEFVDGETLSSAKSERPHGCFDVEEVGPWMEQICEALAYAHNTAKIVHRDLKPANIMLNKSGIIKVTDFGIARSISDSVSRVSMRFASSGTMAYMSPQQSSGARSSSSDDIYALGATIYDLLTGKAPFYSGNLQHQLESITPPSMTERRLELERHGSPIPAVWEKTVAACLEKEVSKRPASVQELAKRLNLRISTPVSTSLPAPIATSSPVTAGPAFVAPIVPRSLPPPRKPLLPPEVFTPARMKLAGIGAGIVVLLIAIPALVMAAIGKGTLSVNTSPNGALISMGGENLTSPATFEKVWSGKKVVTIHLDGYDPVELPAEITKDKLTDLGVVTLTRSTGSLAVTTIPQRATSVLRLDAPPQANDSSGPIADSDQPAPKTPSPIGTGKYNLITTAEGFPDRTDPVEIKRGDTLQMTVDLVKDGALHLLTPDEVTAVNAGQPLPDKMKQDPTEKAALSAYYHQTFEGYLGANEVKLAQDQLKRLSSDLGVSSTDEQKQLKQIQEEWLSDAKSKFNQLFQKERFAAAETLLDTMDAQGTPASTSEMHDTLNKAKAAHDLKIEKALTNIDSLQSSGAAHEAYQAAVKAASDNSGEPRLIKKLATLELPMPSTYDRVSTRLKSMKDLLSEDAALNQDAEFVSLMGVFQKNLDIHNEYRAKMSPLEDQVGSFDSRIASLRREQAHDQKKANGYNALSLLGFAGGIAGAATSSYAGSSAAGVVSSAGVNGAGARNNDIHQLQSEIDDLESQRQGPANQLADLRKQYDTLQQAPINTVQ